MPEALVPAALRFHDGTPYSDAFGDVYHNANGGWQVIPFLVGIIVAVILIAIYLGITGRRGSRTPMAR